LCRLCCFEHGSGFGRHTFTSRITSFDKLIKQWHWTIYTSLKKTLSNLKIGFLVDERSKPPCLDSAWTQFKHGNLFLNNFNYKSNYEERRDLTEDMTDWGVGSGLYKNTWECAPNLKYCRLDYFSLAKRYVCHFR